MDGVRLSEKERERIESLLDSLDDAFYHADLAMSDLKEVPESEDIDDIFAACEDLLEQLSKRCEGLKEIIAADDEAETEAMRIASYRW